MFPQPDSRGISEEEFLMLHHSESGTEAQMNFGLLLASPVTCSFLPQEEKEAL